MYQKNQREVKENVDNFHFGGMYIVLFDQVTLGIGEFDNISKQGIESFNGTTAC